MLWKTVTMVVGLQLLSHAAVVKDPTSALKCRIAGFSMSMVLSPIAEVTSYAFAPSSLLAPINGFDVVWNILLAPYTLGEKATRGKIIGTCLVFFGSTWTTSFGRQVKQPATMDGLKHIFLSWSFGGYAFVHLLIFLCSWAFLRSKQDVCGFQYDSLRGIVLALGGGMLAGQTYFLSATTSLVHDALDTGDWSFLTDAFSYLLIGGAIFCALTNAVILNMGLVDYEAMFIVPVFVGAAMCAACFSAAVLLRETESLDNFRFAAYWSGILLVVSGLVVLTFDSTGRPRDRNAQADEPAQKAGLSSSSAEFKESHEN